MSNVDTTPRQPSAPYAPFTSDAIAHVIQHDGPKILQLLLEAYPSLNRHDGEDILAIGYYRVWKYRHRYNMAKGSLTAWYFRITMNAAMSYVRKTIKLKEVPSDVIEAVSEDSSLYDINMESQYIYNYKTKLKEDAAEFIRNLNYLDYTILEESSIDNVNWTTYLSHTLGKRAGTLRVQLSRIKSRFREFLIGRGHTLPEKP